MAGIPANMQLGFRPGLVQGQGIIQRAHHVVTAVHNYPGDIRQPTRVPHNLIRFQKGVVHEVVALNARQGYGDMGVAEMLHHLGVRMQGGATAFPDRPGLGRLYLFPLLGPG